MADGDRPCDADDLLCQSAALAHLKGLRGALGGDRFKEEFPELQGIDEKIAIRETRLRADLAQCMKTNEAPLSDEPVKVISEEEGQ